MLHYSLISTLTTTAKWSKPLNIPHNLCLPVIIIGCQTHSLSPIHTCVSFCAEKKCLLRTAPSQHKCPLGNAHSHSPSQHPASENYSQFPHFQTCHSHSQTETSFVILSKLFRRCPNSTQNHSCLSSLSESPGHMHTCMATSQYPSFLSSILFFPSYHSCLSTPSHTHEEANIVHPSFFLLFPLLFPPVLLLQIFPICTSIVPGTAALQVHFPNTKWIPASSGPLYSFHSYLHKQPLRLPHFPFNSSFHEKNKLSLTFSHFSSTPTMAACKTSTLLLRGTLGIQLSWNSHQKRTKFLQTKKRKKLLQTKKINIQKEVTYL